MTDKLTEGGEWADDSGDVGFIGEKTSQTPPRGPAVLGGIQIDKRDLQEIDKILPRQLILPLAQLLLREVLAKDGIPAIGFKTAVESIATTTISAGVKQADERAQAAVNSGLADLRALSHKMTSIEAKVDALSKNLSERTGPELELFRAAKDIVSDHAAALRETSGGDTNALQQAQERIDRYSEEISRLQAQLRDIRPIETPRPSTLRPKKGRLNPWEKE